MGVGIREHHVQRIIRGKLGGGMARHPWEIGGVQPNPATCSIFSVHEGSETQANLLHEDYPWDRTESEIT